jgi:ribonuclease P protein component
METPLNVVFPAQAAFSVPVKIFRRATDRNRIKRQMKEVYRMHKSALYDFLKKESKQCALMIVFTGKSKPEFEELKKKITVTLQRFEEDFKKHIS